MSGEKQWHISLKDDLKWYSDAGTVVRWGRFRLEDSVKLAEMLNSTDEIRDLVADWINHNEFYEVVSYVKKELKCKNEGNHGNTVQPCSENALNLAECKRYLEFMDYMDSIPDVEPEIDLDEFTRELEGM